MPKSGLLVVLLVLLTFLWGGNTLAQDNRTEFPQKDNGVIILEDFSEDEPGGLPQYWFNRNADRRPAQYSDRDREGYHYRVMEEDGKRFLRYKGTDAKHLNLPLMNVEQIDLDETPVLSWEWRVHQLPEGGNEESRNYNDTAASVYVVWGFTRLRVPRVMRYTWSSTLPEGHFVTRNFNQQKILVLESGEENTGRWLRFERNIVDDYKKYFGGTPPDRPYALLILSDGDDTRSVAKGDYANFRLEPAAD